MSRGIWLYMSARTRRLLTSTWAALFVFSLLMQYGSFAAPASSLAYVGDSATSPFELDGNAIAQTGHDWNQVYADRNGPPYSTSGAQHIIFAADVTGQGDDILTGGNTKDIYDLSSWLWKQSSTTSVQDKDDIENAFAAAYTAQNGHRIAYFGLDRYSISGDATAGFWFFQNAVAKSGNGGGNGTGFSGVHSEGDLLVVMDFSNGGANGTATVYKWHNGALVNTNVTGGECDGTSQEVCATTNIVDANSPWPYTPKSGTANVFPAAPIQGNSQGAGAFYEGGLDMTALGLDQSCYSSFMAETRSSNTPSSTLSDFVLGQFSFCNPPTLSTQASPSSITIGAGTVSDTATLSGDNGPVTGNVSFFVCGPNASNPDCSTGGQQVGAAVAITSGSATSAGFTPPGVGSYCFRAEYAPDQASAAKYLPAKHTNLTTECFSVTKAKPAITTSAAETVDVGAVIHDTAVLSGGYDPTGTITFDLYGPADDSCSAAPIYTTTATVNGNGTYGPVSYTTAAAGTYHWIASYGGDTKNSGASGACGDNGENDIANMVTPSISTNATASAAVGTQISDSATLSGGYDLTGSIVFKAYGPLGANDAPSCTAGNLVFTSAPVTVTGAGTYGPVGFTATTAGTYYWVASYGGDTNNDPVSGQCGDLGEKSVVDPVQPSIVTTATEGGVEGSQISDTATVTGYQPTGTVDFALYGPNDQTCSANPIFTSTNRPLDGSGQATSDPYTVTLAGTYHWIASYSGDTNNLPVSGQCGDQGETTTVNQFAPTITTSLSSGGTQGPKITILFGNSANDQATLSGASPTAGGTVQYTVYSDSSCSTVFADAGTRTVVDGVVPASDAVSFPAAGTFYWQAHYSGDANNTPATSACQDEVLTVTAPILSAEKLVSVNGGPFVHTSAAQPGDKLSYEITITNSGDGDAANVPVTDDITALLAHGTYGNDCSDGCTFSNGVLSWTIPTIAANGGSKTVTFSVTLSSTFPVGAVTLPNTVVVTGPGSNCEAGSEDAACSTTTTVNQPALTIAKSFTGNSLPPIGGFEQAAPGDTLTYTLAYTLTHGPVTNGVISDVLPQGQTYVDGSATDNAEFTFQSYDSTTRTLTWTAPTVTTSGAVTYQVTIDTNAADIGTLVNPASILSAETDKVTVDATVLVPASPEALTPPPTDTLPTRGPSSNAGFSLMLILLGLAGFALVLGMITPVPERIRRRERDS